MRAVAVGAGGHVGVAVGEGPAVDALAVGGHDGGVALAAHLGDVGARPGRRRDRMGSVAIGAEGRARVARGEELVVDAVMGLAVVVEVAGLARVAESGAEGGPAGRVDGRMRLRLESGMAGRTVERGPVDGVGVGARLHVQALGLPAAEGDRQVGIAVAGQAVLDGRGSGRVVRARAGGEGGEGDRDRAPGDA